jgi:hypothetical protein
MYSPVKGTFPIELSASTSRMTTVVDDCRLKNWFVNLYIRFNQEFIKATLD